MKKVLHRKEFNSTNSNFLKVEENMFMLLKI